MIKNHLKKPVFHIVSGIIGLVITLALWLDNLIKYAKLNEYGWWGIIGFVLVCIFTFLAAFLVVELIMFFAFLIYKK